MHIQNTTLGSEQSVKTLRDQFKTEYEILRDQY